MKISTYIFLMIIISSLVGCTKDVSKQEDNSLTKYICPDCNVVIISIETTRADHMGIYGYQKNTTPFIDSISEKGIIFEKAFAPRGLTWPSLTSMLTSLYPISTDVQDNGPVLDPEIPTIASILNDNNYLTGAFLANFCKAGDFHFDTKYCGGDEQITDQAIRWMEKNKDNKFFFWMHYNAPHRPYTPPKEYDIFTDKDYTGDYSKKNVDQMLNEVALQKIQLTDPDYEHIISLYDGEIFFIDNLIKKVYHRLNELGLSEKSIIIITADHGDDLYQHNYYFFHACSIYESSLQIPLIVLHPYRFENIRVKNIVENIDILPTILDLTSIEKPPYFQGQSLLPLLESKDSKEFNVALGECKKDILTIRTNKWRYIYNPKNMTPICNPEGDYYVIETEELYDILLDPHETTNVIERFPNIAESLKKELLDSYVSNVDVKSSSMANDETLEELKALGYII